MKTFKKILVQIAASFILNKQKRKEFRKKYIIKIPTVQETSNAIMERISRLENELHIKNNELRPSLMHNNGWETSYIKKHYKDFDINSDKIYHLIKNLDEASAGTLCQIIKRLNLLQNKNYENIEIFTEKEALQIKQILEEKNKVLSLANDIYVYKNYFLPINHFETSVFYYKHDITKFQTLDKIRQKHIIDVGAFIGDSALIFSKYTNKKIHSFEPTTSNYENMLKTIELNNIKNIIPIKMGLGSKEENLEIFVQGSCSNLNAPLNEGIAKESIVISTLDKYVKENNIEVGLIKVDIEGFEQEFIKGAIETIKTQKPALLLSIYHNWDDFLNIKPMIESLNLGYTFRIVKPIDRSIVLETLLIAEVI